MTQGRNGIPQSRLTRAVLSPFDGASMQFSLGSRLQLVSRKLPGSNPPIVLRRGELGSLEDESVRFCGTVIPIEDELRIWISGGLS